MSEADRTTGSGVLDERLQGTQQPVAGNGVRSSANSERMAAAAAVGDRQTDARYAPPAVLTLQDQTRLNLGRNAEMPARLIEQSVIKHLADTCKSRGVQVPADMVDFINRARVHFFDTAGNQVELASAMITWEE